MSKETKNTQNIEMKLMPGRGPGNGPRGLLGEKVRSKDMIGTLKRIWRYLQSQKVKLIFVFLIVILTTIFGLLGPYFISIAIDDFIKKGISKGLFNIVIIMFLVYLLTAFFTWLQNYIMISVSQMAVKNMRKDFFGKLQTLSLRFFDQRSNGELMSRLTNDIENVNTTLSESTTQLFSSIFTLIGTIIVMFLLSWQLAIISMLTVPVILYTVKFISNKTRDGYRRQQMNLGKLNGIIEETLTGQRVVKAYCKEEEVIEDFEKVNQNLKEASITAEIFGGFMGPSMNLINNLRFAIIAGAGGYLGAKGIVSVGVVAAFIYYSRQFGRPLTQIANVYNTIQSALAGAERVFEIMDEKPELIDKKDAKEIEYVEGKVKFEKVNFGYNKDTLILKDANFVANKGDTIALVGPTGAGKTTIINLLTRFYDIDSGTISIDGIDIRNIKKDNLRNKLGIVLQDTYLFSESVRENIRYGRLDATDEEVIEAAKKAYAHHFITHLPNGYDTILSQEGSNLSQGQRQLLAIARAILSDPDILILDEATSSVDTRTEFHIQKAMLNLMKGRTSFVIAHRLSTIKDATMILVIKDGEIIERGNHQELLAAKGFYYDLYSSQFRSIS